ncbi:MAG: hypothetical protein GOP50_03910 [Candidatus Heimdallarchaeota archaeon]|nr:hypothetical protein [Candidatus Heimdallarchaeota archaeon]
MSKTKKIDLETGQVLDWKIDIELLTEAFTHPNYISENPNAKDFERLEFLGDAVLDLMSAEWLFGETNEEVGIMSQLRSLLVRTNALAEVGKNLGIAKHVRTESKYQVVETDLEDVVEALFGAFYLSEGRDVTREFFKKLFMKNLKSFKKDLENDEGREKILRLTVCENNPINILQEFFQKRDLDLPEYNMITRKGSDHEPTFHMECKVVIENQMISTVGKGQNRKAAKKEAADKMLKKLKID